METITMMAMLVMTNRKMRFTTTVLLDGVQAPAKS
jgi:hypothetical protein